MCTHPHPTPGIPVDAAAIGNSITLPPSFFPSPHPKPVAPSPLPEAPAPAPGPSAPLATRTVELTLVGDNLTLPLDPSVQDAIQSQLQALVDEYVEQQGGDTGPLNVTIVGTSVRGGCCCRCCCYTWCCCYCKCCCMIACHIYHACPVTSCTHIHTNMYLHTHRRAPFLRSTALAADCCNPLLLQLKYK